jgi:hypothetical protein
MKNGYLYFMLLLLNACSRQIGVEKVNFSTKYCHVSSRIKTTEKGGFILKAIDNQCVTVIDSVKMDSLKMETDDIIRLKTKEKWYKYITTTKIRKECVNDGKDFDDYFSICIKETPAEYLSITKIQFDSLKKTNQTYFYFEKMVLTDTSYIEKQLFSSKPIFSKGKIFHKNGNWLAFKEPNCPSCGVMRTTIRQIEVMLNILGYNTNEDNVLSRDERKQLHDFQRKNGLKVDKVNDETDNKLRALIRPKL